MVKQFTLHKSIEGLTIGLLLIWFAYYQFRYLYVAIVLTIIYVLFFAFYLNRTYKKMLEQDDSKREKFKKSKKSKAEKKEDSYVDILTKFKK